MTYHKSHQWKNPNKELNKAPRPITSMEESRLKHHNLTTLVAKFWALSELRGPLVLPFKYRHCDAPRQRVEVKVWYPNLSDPAPTSAPSKESRFFSLFFLFLFILCLYLRSLWSLYSSFGFFFSFLSFVFVCVELWRRRTGAKKKKRGWRETKRKRNNKRNN